MHDSNHPAGALPTIVSAYIIHHREDVSQHGLRTRPQTDLGGKQFASHNWLEPVVVMTIMLISVYVNRVRDYAIIKEASSSTPGRLLDNDHDTRAETSSDDELDLTKPPYPIPKHRSKRRKVLGVVIRTPNSSRFSNHIHSRIMQRLPFLIEMFYWALNFVTYALTQRLARHFFRGQHDLRDIAEKHGIKILEIEHESWLKVFFPIHEAALQRYIIQNHRTALTFCNRVYSLIHIPGTVLFLCWYYLVAPNHKTFAVVRRTMSLSNFVAFAVFIFCPTMPPRLLPTRFGFHDTVRQDNAESIWVKGSYANQLAAMPSLHFTYAFCIGCTFLYHSGIARTMQKGASKKSPITQIGFLILAVLYPVLVLTVIISTANHYYLDAIAALFTVALSFLINRIWFVLLPLEDLLLSVLRMEKPVPTTGQNHLRIEAFRWWRRKR